MGIQDEVESDPRAAVFMALDDVRTGMLGLVGGGDGVRPMTHFAEELPGVIWFISSTETELVQSLGIGEDAEYVVVSKDHSVHISLRGKLYHLHNDAKLDELWSPVIAAWFEEGRDDPHVALLRFEPEVANIWASTASTLRFGFEIIRANLDQAHKPEVGVKATVRFPKAA
jgi:general stress protein 26